MKFRKQPFLSQMVSEHYDIGEVVACEPIPRGDVNTGYAVDTLSDGETSRYFLREYRMGRTEEAILFEHSVIDHLVAKGCGFVARVIRARDDRTLVRLPDEERDGDSAEKTFCAIFDYLPGEDRYLWTSPVRSIPHLREAATVLAHFHGLVSDLQPKGRRSEPAIADHLPSIAENLLRQAQKPSQTELDDLLRSNLDLVLNSITETSGAISEPDCQLMPRMVIHGDYHAGNLKFENDRVTGLFDFDWSRVDARCLDVALAIVYFCTEWEGEQDGNLQPDRLSAFLWSYQTALRQDCVGPSLTETELKYLPHMIRLADALVLEWVINAPSLTRLDRQSRISELRHLTRLVTWLDDERNRAALERTVMAFRQG